MRDRTVTLALDAPPARVFRFLSRIENLPRWATGFCKALTTVNGKHKIETPAGVMFFRIEADERTGVVDMYGGPAEDQMACWPARVVARPGDGSLFIFTAFQYPGMPDEVFERQCEILRREEFPEIRRHTETPAPDGGEP